VGAREEEEEDWKESPDEAEEEEEEDMVAEGKGVFWADGWCRARR
jgi:CBS domain containing-hemolysin-like protein